MSVTTRPEVKQTPVGNKGPVKRAAGTSEGERAERRLGWWLCAPAVIVMRCHLVCGSVYVGTENDGAATGSHAYGTK